MKSVAYPPPEDVPCYCRKCNPTAWWMIVCGICGNKRCPKATDHNNECTDSNEPNQKGSIFNTITK